MQTRQGQEVWNKGGFLSAIYIISFLSLVFFQGHAHTHKKHIAQHFYSSWSSLYYKTAAIKVFVLETQAEV